MPVPKDKPVADAVITDVRELVRQHLEDVRRKISEAIATPIAREKGWPAHRHRDPSTQQGSLSRR